MGGAMKKRRATAETRIRSPLSAAKRRELIRMMVLLLTPLLLPRGMRPRKLQGRRSRRGRVARRAKEKPRAWATKRQMGMPTPPLHRPPARARAALLPRAKKLWRPRTAEAPGSGIARPPIGAETAAAVLRRPGIGTWRHQSGTETALGRGPPPIGTRRVGAGQGRLLRGAPPPGVLRSPRLASGPAALRGEAAGSLARSPAPGIAGRSRPRAHAGPMPTALAPRRPAEPPGPRLACPRPSASEHSFRAARGFPMPFGMEGKGLALTPRSHSSSSPPALPPLSGTTMCGPTTPDQLTRGRPATALRLTGGEAWTRVGWSPGAGLTTGEGWTGA
jgi:hypothetical protein